MKPNESSLKIIIWMKRVLKDGNFFITSAFEMRKERHLVQIQILELDEMICTRTIYMIASIAETARHIRSVGYISRIQGPWEAMREASYFDVRGTDFTVSTSTGAPLINTSVPIRFTFDSQIKWHGFTTNLVLCPDLGQFLLVTTPQAFPVRQVNVMKPSKHTKT